MNASNAARDDQAHSHTTAIALTFSARLNSMLMFMINPTHRRYDITTGVHHKEQPPW
tara:strand:- start:168 stop:338 length:171 start_codon:yes stop_codon:yes gene_type:complete